MRIMTLQQWCWFVPYLLDMFVLCFFMELDGISAIHNLIERRKIL